MSAYAKADIIREAHGHVARARMLLRAITPAPYAVHATTLQACYRAIHTVTGLAGFCALERIRLLAQETERMLEAMRMQRLDCLASRIGSVEKAIARIASLLACTEQATAEAGDDASDDDDAEVIGNLRAWIGSSPISAPIVTRTIRPALARMLTNGAQITTGPPRITPNANAGLACLPI